MAAPTYDDGKGSTMSDITSELHAKIALQQVAVATAQDLADSYRTQYNRAAEDLKTTRRQLADSIGRQHAMIEVLRSVFPSGYRGDNPVWACEKVVDLVADLRGQAQDANRLQVELEHAEERATQAQADNAALCALLSEAIACGCRGVHWFDIDGEAEADGCDWWVMLDLRAQEIKCGEHPGAALLAELAGQRAQIDAALSRTEALQAENAALRRWLTLAVAAWRAERDGARAFLLGVIVCIFGVLVYFRITNPDMTSMRYMLTYWPYYLVFISLIGAYIFLRSRR